MARFPMLRLLTLTCAVLLALQAAGPTEASFLGDISDVINIFKDANCLLEHQDAVDVCHTLVYPFYGLQASFEEVDNSLKVQCCSRLAAHDCVHLVAKTYCGEVANMAVTIATLLDKIVSSGQCQGYTDIVQCTHPLLLFVLMTLLLASVFTLIGAIIGCICGARKHYHYKPVNF